MSTLSVSNLAFYRNEKILFDNLNFSLQEGEALLVTGPNGVGKSTLLRVLAGLLSPSSGQVLCQNQIAYLGHKIGIKLGLTVIENLFFSYKLAGNKKPIDLVSLLQQYSLNSLKYIVAEKLSAGQKQRLSLAALEMTAAKLWILDEPLTTLDVAGVELLQNRIQHHLNKGGVAVLASHQVLSFNAMQRLDLGLRESMQ